ncbi:hypothetical protein FJY71_06775, partial [candidate division WOR-3 bacterium]|nr:hypothetical protein [candidate division WOR-3 bacterium]
MSRRALLVVFVITFAAMPAFAGWLEVAGGQGPAQVEITQQTSSSTTIEVTIPGIETTHVVVDSLEFVRLAIEGACPATLCTGRPEVLGIPVTIAVPTEGSVSLSVISSEAVSFDVQPVYPEQAVEPWGMEPPPLEYDSAFYQLDIVYPGVDAYVAHTAMWRELAVANICVYPVQVRPGQGTITVVSRLVVVVNHPGTYPASVVDWAYPMYGASIANFGQLDLPERPDTARGTRCLVFCHDNYASNRWLTDSLLGWLR